jgi:hypothetical protein
MEPINIFPMKKNIIFVLLMPTPSQHPTSNPTNQPNPTEQPTEQPTELNTTTGPTPEPRNIPYPLWYFFFKTSISFNFVIL